MSNRQPPKAVVGLRPIESELSDLATALTSGANALATLEPIAALERIERLESLLEASKFQLVRSARGRESSWQRIGRALDLTGEQAKASFGKVDLLTPTG